MMKVNLKNIAEIAGGLVIGILAADAIDEVVRFTKNMVVDRKEKKEEEES